MRDSKLLLDEMLSATLAEQLRKEAWDVMAIIENPELLGLPDSEVLNLATSHKRAVVTLNVSDFARLHSLRSASGEKHSGIWCIPSRRFIYSNDSHSRIVSAMNQERPPRENELLFLHLS